MPPQDRSQPAALVRHRVVLRFFIAARSSLSLRIIRVRCVLRTPGAAFRLSRRNARSSASRVRWWNSAVNRVWRDLMAASFTRTRPACRGLQRCVWTGCVPLGLPWGWSLPSVRLVSFAVINGTTPQSATLPTLEPVLWSPSVLSLSGDQTGAIGRASQVPMVPVCT